MKRLAETTDLSERVERALEYEARVARGEQPEPSGITFCEPLIRGVLVAAG